MSRVSEFKRIVREDFSPDDQELIGRLAGILNPALQEIYSTMNGNISVGDNLNMQFKDIEITVDSTGRPKIPTSYKSDLNGSTKGHHCIKAENLTNTNTYPISNPFISYEQNGEQIIIKNVSGIQADNKYRLRLLCIG